MKIELLEDLPIDQEHQCLKGNIYEATKVDPEKAGRGGRRNLHYFKSHTTGVECAAYPDEFKIIE